jgi:hypothetical protein
MRGQYWNVSVLLEFPGDGAIRVPWRVPTMPRAAFSTSGPIRAARPTTAPRGMCLDALEGRKRDEDARQALLDAAREAQITIHLQ